MNPDNQHKDEGRTPDETAGGGKGRRWRWLAYAVALYLGAGAWFGWALWSSMPAVNWMGASYIAVTWPLWLKASPVSLPVPTWAFSFPAEGALSTPLRTDGEGQDPQSKDDRT